MGNALWFCGGFVVGVLAFVGFIRWGVNQRFNQIVDQREEMARMIHHMWECGRCGEAVEVPPATLEADGD